MRTTTETADGEAETERSAETNPDRKTESDTDMETEATAEGSAVVAELTVPVAEFALGATIDALDGSAIEIERVVAHGNDCLTPFVWVSGSEREAVETALENDPSVSAFDLLADTGDGNGDGSEDGRDHEYLYRTEWSDRIGFLARLLVEEGGTVLAAMTADDRWRFRILLPERGALARTHEACSEAGLTMDLVRIYALEDGRQGRFGLTDEQEDALTLAFERGYYEIPRGTMAKELADVLEISHQALSERLRRAHGNLVENAVVLGRGVERER